MNSTKKRPISHIFQGIENLEQRQMFAAAAASTGVLIDNGQPHDPNMPALYQIGNRWTSTASNTSTGATGTGITLTYSIVPDGTLMGSGNGEDNTGSVFQSDLNAIYGSKASWLPVVQQVFAEWSAISGINYVYEANDDGAALANGSAGKGVLGVRGDVRIGAHPIDGTYNVLAYNWYPNYGDMVIDSNDLESGGFMFNTGSNSLRLRNVMAHEHGHGLGFDHVDPVNNTKLMEAYASTAFDGPQFDDMLAVQRNYGDPFEKSPGNNATANATNRGTLNLGGSDTISNVSLSTTSDVDLYKFTLGSTASGNFSLTPTGPTYLQGPQGGATSSFNAAAQMDLQFQVLSSNGTTVLGTANANGVGGAESLSLSNLAAGTYYLKVLPAVGATDSAQMYTLSTTISGPAAPTTTVALDGSNNLTITDSAGKNDSLTVTADSANSRYVITDPNNTLGTSISGATGNGTNTANVPFASVTGSRVSVTTAGGNDTINITGTVKPVTVDAGTGADAITVTEGSASAPVTIAPATGNDSVNVNTDNTGAANVVFAAAQHLGALTIGAGGVAMLNAPANSALVVQSLTINGSGKLDLRDNDLVIDYSTTSPVGVWNPATSSYTGVTGLVAAHSLHSSLASGSVTGLGIAETSQVGTTFDNETFDTTALVMKYTYIGDVNLDGHINIDDYTRMDLGASTGTSGWYNGDVNLDGKVNIDDYVLIDGNVSAQGGVL
jgi:hypothetical protein